MNTGVKTRILLASFLLIIITIIGSCGGAKPVPGGDKNIIGNIDISDQSNATIITIEGSLPPVYTIFKMTNPLRIAVDLNNVDISEVSKKLAIDNGVINKITVNKGKGSNNGRIEIGLDKLVDYNSSVQGSNLIINVSKKTTSSTNNMLPELGEPAATGMEMSPQTQSSPETQEGLQPIQGLAETAPSIQPLSGQSQSLIPAPEEAGTMSTAPAIEEQPVAVESVTQTAQPPAAQPSEEQPLPEQPSLMPESSQTTVTPAVPVVEESPSQQAIQQPVASKIIDVKYGSSDGKTVVKLIGNGVIGNYNAFRLSNPPRLVIDVLNVGSLYPQKEVSVGTNDVERVRIGQYPDKVRYVFDTQRSQFPSYAIDKKGNELVVSVGSGVQEEGKVVISQPENQIPGAPPPQQISSVSKSPVMFSPAELGMKKYYTGRKISLDFKDADIQDILRIIAEVANKNIITSENVQGKITIRMINVPWDQALDIILQTNKLGMVQVGNIIRIAPLSELRKEEEAQLESKQKQEKLEALVTRIIPVNYAKASDLAAQVKTLLTSRGSVNIDTRTNSIIVKDVPKVVSESEQLVKALDLQTPEVLIEARIVEANTNFSRQLGVQWGGTYNASPAYGNATGLSFPNTIGIGGPINKASSTGVPNPLTGGVGSSGSNFLVNLPAAVGVGSGGGIGMTFGNLTNSFLLDLQLSAMEQTGEGKIISSPKVTTLDNTQAKIQQGLSIPYQTVSQMGTQTQFIDAVLSLEVTPHITANGSIIMKIQVENDAPNTSILSAGGVPSISKKEANTQVLVKNGETTVIGGIYQMSRSKTVSGVPWFYKIPIIGWLFKNTSSTNATTELIVFITPRIVNQ